MSTEDLFAPDDVFAIDPNKNYLEELVGDGKKYKTVEELAYAKMHADATIEQFKTEQNELRNELQTRLNLEKFLDQLKTSVPRQSNDDLHQDDREQQQDKSVMSSEELERLVVTKLNQLESQKSATQNITTVKNKLREVYGPNYAQKLKSQAAELGMTEQELQAVAARSPSAAFKLLGVDDRAQVDNFTTPPRSQVMTLPRGEKRGFNYYENIRKSNIHEYFSPKIQNEMFEARKQMGAESFYNS